MELGHQQIHCNTFSNTMKNEVRKKLKISVLAALVLFLVLYGIFMFLKFNSYQNSIFSKDTGIVLSGNSLKIFGKTETLNGFPDRVSQHYPYFLVIHAQKLKTEVYNIQKQKLEKTYNEVLQDYKDGKAIYNGNGYHTYVNGKDVGIFCDQTFIASDTQILCVTRPDVNSMQNILVSIDLKTHATHTLYTPQDVITAIYMKNTRLYIAEYDYKARKGSVVVNESRTPVSTVINTFYEMKGQVYAASFKSVWNKNNDSFDAIKYENGSIKLESFESGSIIFNR